MALGPTSRPDTGANCCPEKAALSVHRTHDRPPEPIDALRARLRRFCGLSRPRYACARLPKAQNRVLCAKKERAQSAPSKKTAPRFTSDSKERHLVTQTAGNTDALLGVLVPHSSCRGCARSLRGSRKRMGRAMPNPLSMLAHRPGPFTVDAVECWTERSTRDSPSLSPSVTARRYFNEYRHDVQAHRERRPLMPF